MSDTRSVASSTRSRSLRSKPPLIAAVPACRGHDAPSRDGRDRRSRRAWRRRGGPGGRNGRAKSRPTEARTRDTRRTDHHLRRPRRFAAAFDASLEVSCPDKSSASLRSTSYSPTGCFGCVPVPVEQATSCGVGANERLRRKRDAERETPEAEGNRGSSSRSARSDSTVRGPLRQKSRPQWGRVNQGSRFSSNKLLTSWRAVDPGSRPRRDVADHPPCGRENLRFSGLISSP